MVILITSLPLIQTKYSPAIFYIFTVSIVRAVEKKRQSGSERSSPAVWAAVKVVDNDDDDGGGDVGEYGDTGDVSDVGDGGDEGFDVKSKGTSNSSCQSLKLRI